MPQKKTTGSCKWRFTSSEGPDYCKGCPQSCRQSKQCPYTKHAAQTIEETQVWELLHLCQHQIRLSPMGTIVGFDLTPFLALANARDYPVALIAELLQAAEGGMLEAYAESSKR